jgi:membrane fusion protein (multidrug efflux system)
MGRVAAAAVGILLTLVLAVSGAGIAQDGFRLAREPIAVQLVPTRHTVLAAEISAKIENIAFRQGTFFKAGDVLVELDCSLQEAQLQRAKAERRAARATYNGNRNLASLNAVGKVELEKSAAELAVAQAEVTYLDVMLDKCLLTAPFEGAAGAWELRPQQYVQAGQPILAIHDHHALQIEFIVPTAWLDWFKPGYVFAVQIEDTGQAYPATLQRTAARADPVSQSVKAVAGLDGDHPELLAGMSGYLELSPPDPGKDAVEPEK